MKMPYDENDIVHIGGVDHPESIGIGPAGEAFTTGTGCQVYRLDLIDNTAEQFATTPQRCLGQAVDADGNLYAAHCGGEEVLKITPSGNISDYARGPEGRAIICANYPAFDRGGSMYLSESGDWSGQVNGHLLKIPPGGGEAELWYPDPVDTPNGIARIAINDDGSAGAFERVVHMPRHIPDGIAFDTEGRLWIACHRPDAIYVFDLLSRHLHLFASDWKGEDLRGPTDIAFAGPDRDIMLAASLDNLCVHRLDNTGVVGLPLNYPRID